MATLSQVSTPTLTFDVSKEIISIILKSLDNLLLYIKFVKKFLKPNCLKDCLSGNAKFQKTIRIYGIVQLENQLETSPVNQIKLTGYFIFRF